jgi:hypothetical protein
MVLLKPRCSSLTIFDYVNWNYEKRYSVSQSDEVQKNPSPTLPEARLGCPIGRVGCIRSDWEMLYQAENYYMTN